MEYLIQEWHIKYAKVQCQRYNTCYGQHFISDESFPAQLEDVMLLGSALIC
jgi:hypothetical protein